VEKNLLNAFPGFDADWPYAIAHLKLGANWPTSAIIGSDQRLGIYLRTPWKSGEETEQCFHLGLPRKPTAAWKSNATRKSWWWLGIRHILYRKIAAMNSEFDLRLQRDLSEKKLNWMMIHQIHSFFLMAARTTGHGVLGFITKTFIWTPFRIVGCVKFDETFDEIYGLIFMAASKTNIPARRRADENVFDIEQE